MALIDIGPDVLEYKRMLVMDKQTINKYKRKKKGPRGENPLLVLFFRFFVFFVAVEQ